MSVHLMLGYTAKAACTGKGPPVNELNVSVDAVSKNPERIDCPLCIGWMRQPQMQLVLA